MPGGVLSADGVRSTYLRGITLGEAWSGAAGDAAMSQILMSQLAQAEALMNIHFRRWTVLTMPDAGMTLGTTYDEPGIIIPYVPPDEADTAYRLLLGHHDIHGVTRVRLFQGMSGGPTPVPLFETVPLTGLTFQMPDERLVVPHTHVLQPQLALGWAVDYILGMAMLPPEVAEWCSLGTAIQVLALSSVGADVSGGLSGESLLQDGVQETVQYGGARQHGGLYGAPIGILTARQLDIDLSALRFRYQNTLGDRTHLPPDAVIPTRNWAGLLTPATTA